MQLLERVRYVEITGISAYDIDVGSIHVALNPPRGNYLTRRKAKKRLRKEGAVRFSIEKVWEDVYV